MAVIEFQTKSERLGDGTCVVSVAGELDLYTAPELERVLLGALNSGHGSVVVDLSECTFLDSSALGILIEAKRQLANGRLPIVAAAAMRRPFVLTGLDRLFAFHPTLAEARNGSARMSNWHDKEANNQAVFREVNEQIERVAETLGLDEHGSFICECGNLECTQAIELTRGEYEQVRARGNRFALAPDHENPETESVIEQNGRYAVVEMYAGASSRIARQKDPRSQRHTRARKQHVAEERPKALP